MQGKKHRFVSVAAEQPNGKNTTKENAFVRDCLPARPVAATTT